MDSTLLSPIAPADVHGVLARHILADGYDIVMDYERSHGSWVLRQPLGARVPRLPHVLRVEPGGLQPPTPEGRRRSWPCSSGWPS